MEDSFNSINDVLYDENETVDGQNGVKEYIDNRSDSSVEIFEILSDNEEMALEKHNLELWTRTGIKQNQDFISLNSYYP